MRRLPTLLLLLAPGFSHDAAAADPTPTYMIEVEGEAKRTAVKVVPRADGIVVVTDPKGTIEYLPAQRIRTIVDTDGVDWTLPVLRDRERLPSSRRKSEKKWKTFQLRPGPPSACGAYLITESSLTRRVGLGAAGLGDGYVVVEYGFAKNIGRSYSIGGTMFIGITEEHSQEGFRLRLVKWLSKEVSFNLSPGIVAAGQQNDGLHDFLAPGFTLQANLAANGMLGLTLETYTAGRRENSYAAPSVEVHERFTSFGVRLGGLPGIIATPGTLFLGALMGLAE